MQCRTWRPKRPLGGAPLWIGVAGATSAWYWWEPSDTLDSTRLWLDCATALVAAMAFVREVDAMRATTRPLLVGVITCYAASWSMSVIATVASPLQRRIHFVGHVLILLLLWVARPGR